MGAPNILIIGQMLLLLWGKAVGLCLVLQAEAGTMNLPFASPLSRQNCLKQSEQWLHWECTFFLLSCWIKKNTLHKRFWPMISHIGETRSGNKHTTKLNKSRMILKMFRVWSKFSEGRFLVSFQFFLPITAKKTENLNWWLRGLYLKASNSFLKNKLKQTNKKQ